MQNGKKRSIKYLLFLVVFSVSLLAVPFYTAKADDDVKPKKVSLKTKKITVTAGKEFELKAKLTPSDADEDYLVWSIVKGKDVIAFADDDDRYGDDEVEFKALKKGTAKVKVRIKGTKKVAYATITVKAKKVSGTIKRVGVKNRTVEVGDDFELEVKKSSGVKNKHLKWKISNRKIVKFDADDDKYGDEAEFEARKTGKVTITCTNTKTKKKVVYKITVVSDDDADDDDDDD